MYTSGWLTNQYAKIIRPYNITEQQYQVLRILQECYPNAATVNYIIEGMIDKMSNASRLVDKLIAKELVIKVKSSSDMRSVDVLLTDKGLSLLDELNTQICISQEYFLGLDEDELNSLNNLIDILRKNQNKTT